MQSPQSELPHIAADLLERVRERRPRVHCITNAVAQTFTANMLLAAGAVPSMTIAPKEIADFVARADALLVNLGTFDRRAAEGGDIAIDAAARAGIPWVLDPVFIDRSPPRAAFAGQAAARKRRGRSGSTRRVRGARRHARPTARRWRGSRSNAARSWASPATSIWCADGKRLAAIANGHPLMARVTAMGCAGSALVGGVSSRSSTTPGRRSRRR